jgi:hypothetical protein
MQSILSTIAIVAITLTPEVSGFSSGVGSCGAGITAIENTSPGNNHIQYAGYPGSTSTRQGGRGTLADGAVLLQLNGVVIDPAATTTLPVGTNILWEVISTQVTYKGIFVRVEKSSDDFTNVGADATLANVASCDALTGVVGVNHVSSAAKTASSGTINFSSAGTATLDVTVVFDNVDTSLYAWSSYALNIGADVPVAPTVTEPVAEPVAAPVMVPAPVDVPVTEPPVAVPSTEPPVPPTVEPPTAEPPTDVPPTAEPPTTDECPEDVSKGMGKKKKDMGEGMGSGKMNKKDDKMKKMKCKKLPKEPKTPKAGKESESDGA